MQQQRKRKSKEKLERQLQAFCVTRKRKNNFCWSIQKRQQEGKIKEKLE